MNSIMFFVENILILLYFLLGRSFSLLCPMEQKVRTFSPRRLCKMAEDEKSKIKLPIVQILQNGNLKSEFICGNNLEESIVKLRYTLKSLLQASTDGTKSSYINNIYSDSMLSSILDSNSKEHHVIRIYRDGCKKCMAMEPEFFKMSVEYATDGVLWYQAKAEDIPEYTSSIKNRLIGAVNTALINPDNSGTTTLPTLDNCTICKGSGAITCTVCQGLGYNMQGSYAVICSTCGGKKLSRCNNCGGKCLSCS